MTTPYIDIQDYGAIPKPYSFNEPIGQISLTAGSTAASIPPSGFFYALQVGQGVCIYEAGQPTQQATPAAPSVICPATSGTQTLRYACVGLDVAGGLTAASPIGTITNAAIGPQQVTIQSISRDVNGLLTIVTTQPHGFQVQYGNTAPGDGRNPTIVTVSGCMPYTINGRFILGATSIPNPTTIILQTEFLGAPQIGTTSSTSLVTVWGFTTIACTPLSGTTIGYYIYSDSPSPGGSLQLIGKCLLGECHFTDWGLGLMSGYAAPAYVPTIPPITLQNGMFTTTVTNLSPLTLANPAPTTITSTVRFDDGVNLMQAAQVAAGQTGIPGQAGIVFISAPRTATPFAGYYFNSPITLPEWIDVVFGCHCVVNETITATAYNKIDARFGTVSPMQNAQFGQRAYNDISGIANPIVLIGEDQGNSGAVELDGLGFTCQSNGQIAVEVRSAFYTKISNCAFQAASPNFGIAVGLVYLGDCQLAKLEDTCWQFNSSFAGEALNGPPIPALWLRASDNPAIPNGQTATTQFLMTGKHTFTGRGIMLDHLYASQDATTTSITIGDYIWNQAASTPMVMFWGQQYLGVEVHGVVNDTSQEAAVANWTIYQLSDVIVRSCYNALQRIMTGKPANLLTISAVSTWP